MVERLNLVEAVVQVGDEATPYLRSGRGECTLVIAAQPADRRRLVSLLAAAFRVVAPVPPAALSGGPGTGEEFGEWLRGVSEGLGLERPRLVLCPGFAAASAGLAWPGEDEWGEVVIVPATLTAADGTVVRVTL